MGRLLRYAALGAASASLMGCSISLIEPGWFTPPAQKHLIFLPSRIGLSYEPFEIPTERGQTVYGWFIPADDAPATVVINHGALFNRSMLSGYYVALHELGYNVVVYDYQGFGESPDSASLGTLLPDADAVLSHVQGRSDPGADRIVLFGVSLGTLPTIAQAARSPEGVIGVILDGFFVPESMPAWSFPLIGVVPQPEVISRVIAEYPELNPVPYIEQVAVPKLFFQSPQDVITPYVAAEQLYVLAPEPKELVQVFGGHGLPSVLDPDYVEYLREFLTEIAGGPSAATINSAVIAN